MGDSLILSLRQIDLCCQHAMVLPGRVFMILPVSSRQLISELVFTGRLAGLRVLNLLHSFEILLVVAKLS